MTPRNAIAALNELHGQSVNESVVIPTQGNKFEAEITINNVRYVGVGNSKMQAKNAASEKALRDLVINKFRQMKSQEAVVTPLVSESNEDVNMEEEKDEFENEVGIGDRGVVGLGEIEMHEDGETIVVKLTSIPVVVRRTEADCLIVSREKPNTTIASIG